MLWGSKMRSQRIWMIWLKCYGWYTCSILSRYPFLKMSLCFDFPKTMKRVGYPWTRGPTTKNQCFEGFSQSDFHGIFAEGGFDGWWCFWYQNAKVLSFAWCMFFVANQLLNLVRVSFEVPLSSHMLMGILLLGIVVVQHSQFNHHHLLIMTHIFTKMPSPSLLQLLQLQPPPPWTPVTCLLMKMGVPLLLALPIRLLSARRTQRMLLTSGDSWGVKGRLWDCKQASWCFPFIANSNLTRIRRYVKSKKASAEIIKLFGDPAGSPLTESIAQIDSI